jgi:hypothetical protein
MVWRRTWVSVPVIIRGLIDHEEYHREVDEDQEEDDKHDA